MNLKFVGILFAILVVGTTIGEDPTLKIIYTDLKITTAENPYFGELTSEISSSREMGSAKIPIKQTFPEAATVKVTFSSEGVQVADFEDHLCEMMKNEIYGEDLINHGKPAGSFPRGCPVNPGVYEISNYPLPKNRFPPGTPSGNYVAKMLFGEPDKDPWIIVDATFEISHEASNLPKLGR